MIVRTATPDDGNAIATIHVRSEQAAYRGIYPEEVPNSLSVEKQEAAWKERILAGNSRTFVAEQGSQIVGWINAGRCRDSDASVSTGEVYAMYVDPTSWRT